MKRPKFLTVGIDVSARSLSVAWRTPRGEIATREIRNSPEGHVELVRMFTRSKLRTARVAMEATGLYMLDAAIALRKAGVDVMIVNPLQARRFAQACLRRSKTDPIDALLLLDYCERMEWVAWNPPAADVLELRHIARRLGQVVENRVAEENRLHALVATHTASEYVLADLRDAIADLRQREQRLLDAALRVVASSPTLSQAYAVVTSVPGIAERAGIALLGELLVLPKDMAPKQVVAHAGLDPRLCQSGTREAAVHISGVGNARLRHALYMPALTAMRCDLNIRAFADRITTRRGNGKIAVAAVMRKLLCALWKMLLTNEHFQSERFGAPRLAA